MRLILLALADLVEILLHPQQSLVEESPSIHYITLVQSRFILHFPFRNYFSANVVNRINLLSLVIVQHTIVELNDLAQLYPTYRTISNFMSVTS